MTLSDSNDTTKGGTCQWAQLLIGNGLLDDQQEGSNQPGSLLLALRNPSVFSLRQRQASAPCPSRSDEEALIVCTIGQFSSFIENVSNCNSNSLI